VVGGQPQDGREQLTEGIEPDWWAKAILRGWISANDVLAVYHSGRMDVRLLQGFLLFDLEPQEGLRLLAVTAGSLVGVVVSREDNGSRVTVSHSALGLAEVVGIQSHWSTWFDPRELDDVDLTPQADLAVEIHLRSPLGPFGKEICLPFDRDDYRGEPTPAVRRFIGHLERLLPGPRSAPAAREEAQ